MIVNYTEAGWKIITQRAHGVLAAQLAAHWQIKERPGRWTETLLAIAEHDDARIELESNNLLTPQGGPLNFDMQLFELEHCQRLADFALSKSRYIALLTSMHMHFLYSKEIGTNAQAASFLAEQQKLRKQWCRQLKISATEARRIYALLEWCDACSLLLCRQQVQPEGRTIEISGGPSGKHYQLRQVATGQLTIVPWPFEDDSFTAYVEYRIIDQLKFNDNEDFKKAFLAARISEKIWQLVK